MSIDLRELYDKVDGIGREYLTMNGVKVVDQDGRELQLVRNRITEENEVILTFAKSEEVKKLEENWEKRPNVAFVKNKE